MSHKVVYVVGMHRSGTSLTMQALSAIGAKPGGAMIAGDDHNKMGYWEAAEIVAFHDELLSGLGRGWGSPEHMIPVPTDWFSSSEARDAGARARAILKERLSGLCDGDMLVIKDPRMSLFLPLWIDAAKELDVEPNAIICLRHPDSVSKSLQKRDHTSYEMSISLWLNYTISSLANSRALPVFLSHYQDWLRDNKGTLSQLGEFIGLDVSKVENPFDRTMVNSVEEGLVQNALVETWWNELSGYRLDIAIPDDIFERATSFIDQGQMMIGLAAAIRSEVGETPTFVAKRDLESYRSGFADLLEKHNALGEERDALAARAQELLDAYQASAVSREDLMKDYLKVPAVIRRLTRLRK